MRSSARARWFNRMARGAKQSSTCPTGLKAANEHRQYRTPTQCVRARGLFPLKANNKVVISFAAAAILVALVVSVSLWGFRQLGTAAEAREHSHQLILRAETVLSDLTAAVPSYLKPHSDTDTTSATSMAA